MATSSFYNQATFITEDIVVTTVLVDNCDDEDSSFDPFIDDLQLFDVLGAMFEEDEPRAGGSVIGRKYVHHDKQAAHDQLVTDYFARYPRFDEDFFRRRFHMRKPLFNKILKVITAVNPFFTQKRVTFWLGITPLVKMTVAIRMLSYACAMDTQDEWLKIGESTVIECLVEQLNSRRPQMKLILKENYPVAWKGQHTGHTQGLTFILECVADYEPWIWHTFFGMAGSHNDLSVLENSHIFEDLTAGTALPCNYVVNGVQYNMGYYIADGIYHEWATLIQSLKNKASNEMEKYFVKRQDSCRKDVESTFGILQARWNIAKQPTRFWDRKTFGKIMKICVILHNIIIQDEHGLNLPR